MHRSNEHYHLLFYKLLIADKLNYAIICLLCDELKFNDT